MGINTKIMYQNTKKNVLCWNKCQSRFSISSLISIVDPLRCSFDRYKLLIFVVMADDCM